MAKEQVNFDPDKDHVAMHRVPDEGSSLEDVEQAVGMMFYCAGLFFERLEDRNLIHGNGFHIAQKISEKAKEILREHWITKTY